MKDVLSLAVFVRQSAVPHGVRDGPEARRQHRRRPDVDEPRRLPRRAFGDAGMRPESLCTLREPASGSALHVRVSLIAEQ